MDANASRKVVKAEVVPCNGDEFGIAWSTSDGGEGIDKVGTREQAEALLKALRKLHGDRPDVDAAPFSKDVAAS